MMKPSAVLLTLVIAIASIGWISPANAGNISQSNNNSVIWYDMFSDPADRSTIWDGYVEAHRGDTVVAFIEANNNWAGWYYINYYRSGVWWDTAVLERPESYWDYSQAPLIAEDGVTTYGTVTQGGDSNNYTGTENASYYGGANYQEVEIPFSGGYNYQMRIVGWSFTVKDDAPLGITAVGSRTYMWATFYYQWFAEYRVESDDPFALHINVIADLPGDFNTDGFVDADDIDMLCDNLGDPAFDLDDDGDADEDDMIFLIENLVEWDNGVDNGVGTKRGDFNLDGFVDGTDLALMKTAFGQPLMDYADGNANCDAFVDGTDLAILKTSFGFIGSPAGGVPEPATLSLLALGGMALLRRRSR
ncbi:hypothetical protein LCGC14_0016260 [marine sediment metagenome]|uniref:Ice-binding protein C-terminal domain-containing protein n=1 Tax=marine sediment metagenome TaxID=412755 RepID=A0A0F9W452_9ZZZZ